MQEANFTLTPPAPPPLFDHQAINPDAELIALCAQHIVNIQAYNGRPEDADEELLWEEYLRTLDAITDTNPQTVEGIAAKALAAKAEAANPDGSEDPECCHAARWAWQITNDLLRLSGRAGA